MKLDLGLGSLVLGKSFCLSESVSYLQNENSRYLPYLLVGLLCGSKDTVSCYAPTWCTDSSILEF